MHQASMLLLREYSAACQPGALIRECCAVGAGAHTLGRAYPNRSGFGKESTKYTKDGPGTKGGSSWTPEWCAHP